MTTFSTAGLVAELSRAVGESRTWQPIWAVWRHVVSTTLRRLVVPDGLTPVQAFAALRAVLPGSLCFQLMRQQKGLFSGVALKDAYVAPDKCCVDVVAARAFEAVVVPSAAAEEAFHAEMLAQLQKPQAPAPGP